MPDNLNPVHPEGPSITWKLIVAAEAPWVGEIYHTRPGNQRHRFNSVEEFCGALLEVTGWPLDMSAPPSTRHSYPHGHRLRSGLVGESASAKRKFIVAAHAAWMGEIYRTRPGLRRFPFATFEEFLLAVLSITGWPLVNSTRRDLAAIGPGLSRPVSAR